MASRIRELCINCADVEVMAAFWSAALGYRVVERADDGVVIAGAPDRPSILLARTDDADGPTKHGPNRFHLDLSPTDGDRDTEVERLVALGARRIDIGQGTPTWVVLADPEGNEFCVLQGRVAPEPQPFAGS